MTHAIAATDSAIVPTLREFWRNYNIWNAINNIAHSWAEVRQSTINKAWRNLCQSLCQMTKTLKGPVSR
jgi:hypothetical protein